ncbi:MAG TPA: hypothetical protein VK836_13370 [Streptosporangiaceae bacterium]|nr:hypothetical protein [Streptosporangiaceae bacterium]
MRDHPPQGDGIGPAATHTGRRHDQQTMQAGSPVEVAMAHDVP